MINNKELKLDYKPVILNAVDYWNFLSSNVCNQDRLIIGAYKLQKAQLPDEKVLSAVKGFVKDQVNIKVITENRLTPEETKGQTDLPEGAALNAWHNTGAEIISWIKAFENVHAKFAMVDNKFIVIGTTNYEDPHHESNAPDVIKRDFSIVLKDPRLVKEASVNWSAILSGGNVVGSQYSFNNISESSTELVWGGIDLAKHLLQIIGSTKLGDVIKIYQQDLQFNPIVNILTTKCKENVIVEILMSQHPFGINNPNSNINNLLKLKGAGAKIRLTDNQNKLHIHAKMLLVDYDNKALLHSATTALQSPIMYLGSANFYPGVLSSDKNCNLGIITKDAKYIDIVREVFINDWNNTAEYDIAAKK